MAAAGLRDQLQHLHALILQERDCARRLAMEELQAVTAEKEAFLQTLELTGDADPELRALAERIRAENRRNAYLFWSALNWVRDLMGFFGQKAVPVGYGAGGTVTSVAASGRLLSGRV